MGCVVLVIVLPSLFVVAVPIVVDVAVASVVVFVAAARLVLVVVVVLSILRVVIDFVTVDGNVIGSVVVNVIVGIGKIEDLLNCVTGSTKETQSRYEKVNLNKV